MTSGCGCGTRPRIAAGPTDSGRRPLRGDRVQPYGPAMDRRIRIVLLGLVVVAVAAGAGALIREPAAQ